MAFERKPFLHADTKATHVPFLIKREPELAIVASS